MSNNTKKVKKVYKPERNKSWQLRKCVLVSGKCAEELGIFGTRPAAKKAALKAGYPSELISISNLNKVAKNGQCSKEFAAKYSNAPVQVSQVTKERMLGKGQVTEAEAEKFLRVPEPANEPDGSPMKIAVGSDERNGLTDEVVRELEKRGAEVELFGPLADKSVEWAEVAGQVAEKVSGKECDQGILFCWTGTGVSIAANKVPGIRAALCTDAETAAGARKWNDANVLAMSLRLTSPTVAKEILDAWFENGPDPSEKKNVDKVGEIESRHAKK